MAESALEKLTPEHKLCECIEDIATDFIPVSWSAATETYIHIDKARKKQVTIVKGNSPEVDTVFLRCETLEYYGAPIQEDIGVAIVTYEKEEEARGIGYRFITGKGIH
tara:strand:- start:134 stop:457 length:324 start_codon:yes stop_codon:yes gene_type:complete